MMPDRDLRTWEAQSGEVPVPDDYAAKTDPYPLTGDDAPPPATETRTDVSGRRPGSNVDADWDMMGAGPNGELKAPDGSTAGHVDANNVIRTADGKYVGGRVINTATGETIGRIGPDGVARDPNGRVINLAEPNVKAVPDAAFRDGKMVGYRTADGEVWGNMGTENLDSASTNLPPGPGPLEPGTS